MLLLDSLYGMGALDDPTADRIEQELGRLVTAVDKPERYNPQVAQQAFTRIGSLLP